VIQISLKSFILYKGSVEDTYTFPKSNAMQCNTTERNYTDGQMVSGSKEQ